jgi:hypothetical protein
LRRRSEAVTISTSPARLHAARVGHHGSRPALPSVATPAPGLRRYRSTPHGATAAGWPLCSKCGSSAVTADDRFHAKGEVSALACGAHSHVPITWVLPMQSVARSESGRACGSRPRTISEIHVARRLRNPWQSSTVENGLPPRRTSSLTVTYRRKESPVMLSLANGSHRGYRSRAPSNSRSG